MKLHAGAVDNGVSVGKVILAIAACVLAVAGFTPQAGARVVTAAIAPAGTVEVVSVGAVAPGPASFVLLGTGLLGLGGAIRRRIWHG